MMMRIATVYPYCQYSKDVHRTKCHQALTIVRLTHSLYAPNIARIRCYSQTDRQTDYYIALFIPKGKFKCHSHKIIKERFCIRSRNLSVTSLLGPYSIIEGLLWCQPTPRQNAGVTWEPVRMTGLPRWSHMKDRAEAV